MIRRVPVVLLLLSSGLLLSGACKKDEEPQSIPVPTSAASAAPVAADPTAAATTAAAAPTASASAASATPAPEIAPQPATGTQNVAAAKSIEGCCAALKTMATSSGKSAESKSKANGASTICYRIAKLVKEGKTSRQAAMTQIKSSLGGVAPPSECN